jgi:hypothetical protein
MALKRSDEIAGLYSIRTVRAFEAAARHLSLTKAALELNVTPGAPPVRAIARTPRSKNLKCGEAPPPIVDRMVRTTYAAIVADYRARHGVASAMKGAN